MCTNDGCTHITEGADDPTVPMPAKLWPTPRCYAAWLRDRDLAARDGRPELVDEHRADCTQHGPRTSSSIMQMTWLGPDVVRRTGGEQYTYRGDRAS